MGSPPRIARRSVVDAEPGVCVFTPPSVPNGVEEALPPGGTSAPQICNLDCQYPNLIHNLTIREPSNPPSGETVPVIAELVLNQNQPSLSLRSSYLDLGHVGGRVGWGHELHKTPYLPTEQVASRQPNTPYLPTPLTCVLP